MIFKFENYSLDTEQMQFFANGSLQKVEPQVFAILALLIQHHDRVVTKDEINKEVWGGRVVSDAAVNSRIHSARLAIGDDGKTQQFIKTIPNIGFKFVGSLQSDDDDFVTGLDVVSEGAILKPRSQASLFRKRYFWIAILCVVALTIFTNRDFLSNQSPAEALRPSRVSQASAISDILLLEPTSIAVLPFVDMSAKGDQAYFSDGIAEELLNVLAQIPGLEVAGRTSSFSFKNKNMPIKEIGDILNVSYMLEGSVRKSDDKIRVSVKLINTETGFQRWTSTYGGDLKDIFAVQDEISQAIVTELTPHLSQAFSSSSASKTIRGDLGAYGLYLSSKQYARAGTFEAYLKAAKTLDKALEIDPNYVPALAWRGFYEMMICDAPGFQGVSGVANVPAANDAIPTALEFINKALAIQPNSPDALFARATAFSVRAEDAEKAERDYRRAIELKPNFPLAQNDLAVLLESQLKFEDSLTLFKKALSHDPGLADANFNLFQSYLWRSQFSEAQRVLDNWGRISPEDQTRQRLVAEFAFDTGDMAKGMTLAQNILDKSPDSPQVVRFLASGWLALGEYSKVLLSHYDHHHPFALNGLGDKKEGKALAQKNNQSRPDDVEYQQVYMNYLFLNGDWEALTEFYLRTYGSPKALKDSDSYPPLEKVAAALVATDHPHAKDMIKITRLHINKQRANSITLSVLDQEDAILLILEDKPDEALARLRSAYEKGSYDLNIKLNPVYNRLAGKPAYEALMARMIKAINVERGKLDLDPIVLPG